MALKTLWTNSTGTFTAGTQKISLDLSKYNGIIIQFIGKVGWTSKWHFYIPKNTNLKCWLSVEQDSTINGGCWWRTVTCDENFVNIGYALDDTSLDKTNVIPTKIYGI